MELRKTDLLVINHVARYRVTFNEPLQRHVFPASKHGGQVNALKVTGEAATALARLGYLKDRHGGERFILPGQRKYYTLGEESLKLFPNLPKSAVEPPGPQALAQDLCVNWFCNMKALPACRVGTGELVSNCSKAISFPQNVVHCAREEDIRVLYRVYVASAKSPRRSAEQLATHIRSAWDTEWLRPAVASREYGFAVLTPTPQAGRSVEKAVEYRLGRLELTGAEEIDLRVVVASSPVPETIGFALSEYKRSFLKSEGNTRGCS